MTEDNLRLIFVRHGESEANILHVVSNRGWQHGLTERGREQARALAKRLQAETPAGEGGPIVQMWASPLRRAVETADIVARELAMTYRVTDALREYDCGVLEGRSDDEAWRAHERWWMDWLAGRNRDRGPDEGETFYDIRDRFVLFVEALTGDLQLAGGAGQALLVGHGGLFRLMLPLVLANVGAHFAAEAPLDHTICILAERRGGRLICLKWGAPLASAADI